MDRRLLAAAVDGLVWLALHQRRIMQAGACTKRLLGTRLVERERERRPAGERFGTVGTAALSWRCGRTGYQRRRWGGGRGTGRERAREEDETKMERAVQTALVRYKEDTEERGQIGAATCRERCDEQDNSSSHDGDPFSIHSCTSEHHGWLEEGPFSSIRARQTRQRAAGTGRGPVLEAGA